MAVTAAALLLAGPARAGEDDAAWISGNPAYVTAAGVHCCGSEHCRRARAGEVQRIAGGWHHAPTNTDLMDGQQGVYDSKDADMWVCVWGDPQREQCVFPGIGT